MTAAAGAAGRAALLALAAAAVAAAATAAAGTAASGHTVWAERYGEAAGAWEEAGARATEGAQGGRRAAGGGGATHATAPAPGGSGGAGSSAHWVFMSGVGAGDSFSYRICDSLYPAARAALPHAGPPAPHSAQQPARAGHVHAAFGGGGACYSVVLHVEAVVAKAGGGTGGPKAGQEPVLYVVRAEAGPGAGGGNPAAGAGLLVVDSERFSVLHVFAGDRPLAESLQRTVFWRDGWGGRVPLAYGEPVVELLEGAPSSALLVSGSRVQAGGGARVEYVASHGVRIAGGAGAGGDGVSTLVVADGVGLPVSARIYPGSRPPLDHYAARPVFEFELERFKARQAAEGAGHEGPGQAAEGAQGARGARAGPPIYNPHYAVHGAISR